MTKEKDSEYSGRINNISILFSCGFLVLYFLYIVIISFFPQLMSIKINDNSLLNVAFFLGGFIPAVGVVLTGVYVMWADRIDCKNL
ncbi:DUF485 domain-containing protein [Acetobacter tropicalis]|uniref:DUF485 domain-containing protein n=1 Tax=Acetobacter tropicalis TaxID=104102 RepID=UPI000A39F35A